MGILTPGEKIQIIPPLINQSHFHTKTLRSGHYNCKIEIIHRIESLNQTGLITSCSMYQNVERLFSLINHMKKHYAQTVFTFLDTEKAFDRVEWNESSIILL